MAVTAVIAASGLARGACVTSRSHTRGVGAAVAAPLGWRVGVDLVVMDRVGARHADALLGEQERSVLEGYGKLGPALAWALKEAAAKASGDPTRRFPLGLGIEMAAGGLIVRAGGMELAARWEVFGELLCGWVWTEALRWVMPPSLRSG